MHTIKHQDICIQSSGHIHTNIRTYTCKYQDICIKSSGHIHTNIRTYTYKYQDIYIQSSGHIHTDIRTYVYKNQDIWMYTNTSQDIYMTSQLTGSMISCNTGRDTWSRSSGLQLVFSFDYPRDDWIGVILVTEKEKKGEGEIKRNKMEKGKKKGKEREGVNWRKGIGVILVTQEKGGRWNKKETK